MSISYVRTLDSLFHIVKSKTIKCFTVIVKDNRVCKLFISYLNYTIKSGICTENAEFSMIFAVKCTDDEWCLGKLLSVVLHF